MAINPTDRILNVREDDFSGLENHFHARLGDWHSFFQFLEPLKRIRQKNVTSRLRRDPLIHWSTLRIGRPPDFGTDEARLVIIEVGPRLLLRAGDYLISGLRFRDVVTIRSL